MKYIYVDDYNDDYSKDNIFNTEEDCISGATKQLLKEENITIFDIIHCQNFAELKKLCESWNISFYIRI